MVSHIFHSLQYRASMLKLLACLFKHCTNSDKKVYNLAQLADKPLYKHSVHPSDEQQANFFFTPIPKHKSFLSIIVQFFAKTESEKLKTALLNFCRSVIALNDAKLIQGLLQAMDSEI